MAVQKKTASKSKTAKPVSKKTVTAKGASSKSIAGAAKAGSSRTVTAKPKPASSKTKTQTGTQTKTAPAAREYPAKMLRDLRSELVKRMAAHDDLRGAMGRKEKRAALRGKVLAEMMSEQGVAANRPRAKAKLEKWAAFRDLTNADAVKEWEDVKKAAPKPPVRSPVAKAPPKPRQTRAKKETPQNETPPKETPPEPELEKESGPSRTSRSTAAKPPVAASGPSADSEMIAPDFSMTDYRKIREKILAAEEKLLRKEGNTEEDVQTQMERYRNQLLPPVPYEQGRWKLKKHLHSRLWSLENTLSPKKAADLDVGRLEKSSNTHLRMVGRMVQRSLDDPDNRAAKESAVTSVTLAANAYRDHDPAVSAQLDDVMMYLALKDSSNIEEIEEQSIKELHREEVLFFDGPPKGKSAKDLPPEDLFYLAKLSEKMSGNAHSWRQRLSYQGKVGPRRDVDAAKLEKLIESWEDYRGKIRDEENRRYYRARESSPKESSPKPKQASDFEFSDGKGMAKTKPESEKKQAAEKPVKGRRRAGAAREKKSAGRRKVNIVMA